MSDGHLRSHLHDAAGRDLVEIRRIGGVLVRSGRLVAFRRLGVAGHLRGSGVKRARRASLMATQSEISLAKNRGLVGREIEVLVEGAMPGRSTRLRGRPVRAALLRHLAERAPPLVLDGALRKPGQGRRLSRPGKPKLSRKIDALFASHRIRGRRCEAHRSSPQFLS